MFFTATYSICSEMLNTDSNCPGRAQGTAFDTFAEQRNAMQLQELLNTVDGYFEDYGLAGTIETFNVMFLAMLPHDKSEDEPVEWSSKFILDCAYQIGNVTHLLAKLYELRRTHLYKSAQV